MLDYQLKTELRYVGEVLNLKEHKTRVKVSTFEPSGPQAGLARIPIEMQAF